LVGKKKRKIGIAHVGNFDRVLWGGGEHAAEGIGGGTLKGRMDKGARILQIWQRPTAGGKRRKQTFIQMSQNNRGMRQKKQ